MPYTLQKGNLIELFKIGNFDVLVHGCNCYNIMGAGFAKQVKDNFPEAYLRDKQYVVPKGIHRLGDFSVVNIDDKYVVNAYTQLNTGKNFDLSAFELAMKKIEYNFIDCRIAVPGLIGCGIGGGNPTEVLEVLDKTFVDNKLFIVYPN